MESDNSGGTVGQVGSKCLYPEPPKGRPSRKLAALAVVLCICPLIARLDAQPAAASLATHSLPIGIGSSSVIDALGNVYTAGSSNAGGAVTPGAAQTGSGGGLCPGSGQFPNPVTCTDAYVAKIDPTGNMVFGTFLGGPTADTGTAVAVDGTGNVFVAGTTGGSFPTSARGAIPASESSRVFAAKLSPDGSSVIYSTYLPDTAATAAAIGVDSQGNAYVTGATAAGHAYVTKLSADGSAILYDITLGGSGQEAATALAVDAAGNAALAGQTSSPDFPVTPGALQAYLSGKQNLFVTRLDGSGKVVFSTYLGGSGTDQANTVQTDPMGNQYVAGATTSMDFPTTAGSFQPVAAVPGWSLSPGGFIAKIAADGTLVYASYVPSLGVPALAVTASGEAYIGGTTGAGFPITETAPQPCFGGWTDGFVAHLDPQGAWRDATYLGDLFPNSTDRLAVAADGSISVLWNYGGRFSASQIRFGQPGWTAPACLSPDVLNAAMFFGLGTEGKVAPGELITLTGFGIGPRDGVVYQPALTAGLPPRELAGVRVLFDGQPAPLLYAQSRQVNAQVPFEVNGESLTSISLEYNGVQVGQVIMPVVFAFPGTFRQQLGISAQAAAWNEDGTVNSPANPASAGSLVTLWSTGLGPTDPPCATGGLDSDASSGLAPGVQVTLPVGGPAESAGSVPGLLCGIVQVTVRLPGDAPPGPYLIRLGVVKTVQTASGTSIVGAGNDVGATIAVK